MTEGAKVKDWCTSLGDAEGDYVQAIKLALPIGAGMLIEGVSQFTHQGRIYIAVGWADPKRKWAVTVPGEDGKRPTVDQVVAAVRNTLRLQGADQNAPSLPS